jgi:hypothetical protein
VRILHSSGCSAGSDQNRGGALIGIPRQQAADKLTRIDELLELLITKTGGDVASSSQLYEGGADTLKYFSEVWLMFNSDGDLIKIRKHGGKYANFEREVDDAEITNTTVDDTKTIKFKKWNKVFGE